MDTAAGTLMCPYCSCPPELYERPAWSLAGRTSASRGVSCWIHVGCSHSTAVAPKSVVDDAGRKKAEETWNLEVVNLFQKRTARWSDEQRSAFWRKLEYPGACPQRPPPEPEPAPAPSEPSKENPPPSGANP